VNVSYLHCCNVAGSETMLSDIVACGPASVCLSKPVILSLPHCAADSIDRHWSLIVVHHPIEASDTIAATWRVGHRTTLNYSLTIIVVHKLELSKSEVLANLFAISGCNTHFKSELL